MRERGKSFFFIEYAKYQKNMQMQKGPKNRLKMNQVE